MESTVILNQSESLPITEILSAQRALATNNDGEYGDADFCGLGLRA